jgi:hypothetical protein
MPEELKKAEEVKEEKIIDLDTSGPDVEVTLPEEKDKAVVEVKEEVKDEKPVEEPVEEPVKSEDAPAKSDEQPDVQKSESETEDQKQELEDYSKGVKTRIAKLTKRMREAERQREAALTYAKSVNVEQKSLKDRLSKLELGYEEARLAEMKVTQKQEEEQRKTLSEGTIPQAPLQPTPDAKATEWAQKNSWFGKDNAMTYTAFDLHKKLVDDEGYDPQSTDYYGELDRRIKLEFPNKFGNTTVQTSRPKQTVASATRTGYKDGRRTVKLTSSQVAIANKLNVPLEEYAKQLNIVKET